MKVKVDAKQVSYETSLYNAIKALGWSFIPYIFKGKISIVKHNKNKI